MKELEKYITDERTELKYELVGGYYFIAGYDEPEEHPPIGIWGSRRFRYIRQRKRILFTQLLLLGNLNNHLADINEQAADMFSRHVKEMANCEGVTE